MFRSATFKLTVWYLCLVMAVSLIFSTVVYQVGSSEIARSLHVQSERIYTQFPVLNKVHILKPTKDIDAGDHLLFLRLILINIIVFVLAGLASYLLAKRTLEPIEQAHEQQKRFTSDVSHELRTPLTALKMTSEVALINPKTTTKELRSALKSNLEESAKLENLINNILKLSKMETNELKQGFTKLSSSQLIDAAIKQVEPKAKQRKVNIESADVIDKPFYGDNSSLTELLVILLDNAIKYSKSGSTVKVEAITKDNRLIIKIIDQGIGISGEALKHIFDRFYQEDTSRSKSLDKEGYGLGLSIAKMIADVHDASITVSSQLDKGTTVKIDFPLDAKN